MSILYIVNCLLLGTALVAAGWLVGTETVLRHQLYKVKIQYYLQKTFDGESDS